MGTYAGGGRNCSVWSAAEQQAAQVVPTRSSIDWNAIRENKGKYEELKWQGEGSYCVINVHKLQLTDTDIDLIGYPTASVSKL